MQHAIKTRRELEKEYGSQAYTEALLFLRDWLKDKHIRLSLKDAQSLSAKNRLSFQILRAYIHHGP